MQRLKIILFLTILLLCACTPEEEVAALVITPTREETVTALVEVSLEVDESAEISTPIPLTQIPTTESTAGPTNEPTLVPPTAEQLTITPLPATQHPTTETTRRDDAVSVPTAMQSFIDTLIDDLVSQKGVERDTVRVIEMQEIVWNNGSLGCPQPGMAYTQALVDGFYVLLRANGNDYAYHTSGTRHFVLCEDSKGAPPAGGSHPDA